MKTEQEKKKKSKRINMLNFKLIVISVSFYRMRLFRIFVLVTYLPIVLRTAQIVWVKF